MRLAHFSGFVFYGANNRLKEEPVPDIFSDHQGNPVRITPHVL
jgi:hypothetical protein